MIIEKVEARSLHREPKGRDRSVKTEIEATPMLEAAGSRCRCAEEAPTTRPPDLTDHEVAPAEGKLIPAPRSDRVVRPSESLCERLAFAYREG